MRISDWSSDVCSSDLRHLHQAGAVDAAMPTPAPDIGLARITLRHRDPVAFQRVDRRSMTLVHLAFGTGVDIPLRPGRALRAARPVIGNGGLAVVGSEKRGGPGPHAAVPPFHHFPRIPPNTGR